MRTRLSTMGIMAVLALTLAESPPLAWAQPPAGAPRMPPVLSPEVAADRRVSFRIVAPKAEAVRLTSSDMPGNNQGATLKKGENGVWEVTLGPIVPGAYRYAFNVDGVATVDPRNPTTSESNNNVWSLVHVPGSELLDAKDVPHGAVAAVKYYSKSLKKHRRMHVYTPPGYEADARKYPVLYLLHGASDSDASWSSVGRAGYILDNLIAAGKAKPMLVVMPAGHTGSFAFGGRGAAGRMSIDEFVQEFNGDIMPYVEKTYRVSTERQHRAIAGLSMGGMQTLNIAIPKLDKFAYVGVYSSGVFGIAGGNRPGAPRQPTGPAWEEVNKTALDNGQSKPGLKLFWFGTGKDDFLVETTRATVAMLKKHDFAVAYDETDGGHTWLVWRKYLSEFAPKLFQ